MTPETALTLIVAGVTGLLVFLYIFKRSTEKRAQLEIVQQQKLGEIRSFQEELVKLQTASIRDTDAYKEARRKYVERYKDAGHSAPSTDGSNDSKS